MKFKFSFTIDSEFMGSIAEALYHFPIEEFGMQADEKNIKRLKPAFRRGSNFQLNGEQSVANQNTAMTPALSKSHYTKGKKRYSQRGLRPTVKDAIWNFVKGTQEPQSIRAIRETLISRGYNQNSIPNAFQELKSKGRLEQVEGDFRPQRYIAISK